MEYIARLGRKVINFFAEFGKMTILLINIFRYFPRIFKDRKIVVEQMSIIGADSLPLVILIGSFTGAIAALQATLLFSKFNLIEITRPFLGASIATAVFTELTPVLTALIAQREKDEAVQKFFKTLRDYWTVYYTIRKLTLYDFKNDRQIFYQVAD